MIRLAPNVYVLRYLTNTESGTDADKARALSNVQSGITREMTFRHADGSFSAWIHRPSSTWLTAFVGKVFCQASEFTFVDTKGSCGAIKWLMTVQRGDGAFVEGLAVIHKEMSGGVQGDAAMTAFALIAMSECQCVAEVPDLASSSSRAAQFLESQLETIQRPYVVAIVTYALALVDSDRRFDANNMLKSLATYDAATGTRHWGTDASSLNHGSRPYWYQRRPSAISVETTGYALLAQLALGEISYSHPIVKWLSQQQNYGGGFVSTQDTVIALQALSEYATLNTGGNLDMYCNVTAPEDFRTVLHLQEGEALVQKTRRIPPRSIKGKLMIKTGGEGVGQLNVEVKYNDLADNSDADCRFNLSVTSERIDGEEGTPFARLDKVRVRVCATYLGEEQTSMAILDVGLYSGFAPVTESLQNLVGGDGLIERTERSDRSVIFYADHIPVDSANPLCFEFEAVCEIVVGNLQHAAVHVYDYYDPAEECTRFYAPEGTNLLGTLCSNEGMCSCVSSKCAACSGPDGETEDDLLEIACATAETYVYKIVVNNIERQSGFNVITAMVEQVFKRGDDQIVFENLERKFWVSSSCDCPDMRQGRKYMVMGRNYLRYEEEVDLPGYKYIIDHTTTVRWWRKGRRFSGYLNRVGQRILNGDSNCG